jgi:hypothetical protein
MHALYREGGARRALAPQAIYEDDTCTHPGCDPLVRAWWGDVGFAGRCPKCPGWIHFTIRGKRANTAEEAAALPNLPDDWADVALIL